MGMINWFSQHRRTFRFLFIYLPIATLVFIFLYVGYIYLNWQGDKAASLNKLSRYKRLIDLTEEKQKGYSYSLSDIDLGAKVVDLPTRIYDRNNEVIGEFFEQKREIVPYEQIPQSLVNAVIASEDRNFYEHKGVSYKGIFRAMLTNLSHFRLMAGGSTITQQLAKVLFTDMERSMKRKVYEAYCAREIEEQYDKNDILSMYLNLIYLGNGAYGVESAAKMYFGKSVNTLSEPESAMIVASISNPLLYSPLNNLDNSIKKTRKIMHSRVAAGYTTQDVADAQYERFLNTWDVVFDDKGKAVSSLIGSFSTSSYRINRAPFFNEQVRRVLYEKFGPDAVKKGGLNVYTTLDGVRQDLAVKYLREGIAEQRNYQLQQLSKSGNASSITDNIEGAFVSVNPFNGEIIAYAGGYELTADNQVDFVQQGKRQPGSSFKPIIYTVALEEKVITPSTIFRDEATTFEGKYSPSNYSGNYLGDVTVRDALRKSINIVAVKVLEKTGYNKLFSFLQKALDLSDDDFKLRFNKTLSLALGTYEISPLENCRLQSIIVNGGDYVKPYGIKLVKDYQGNIIWNNEEEITAEIEKKREEYGKLLEPQACAITVSMLKGVFQPGGTAYFTAKDRGIKIPISGKTGTSTNYNDAWFVGYTPDTVTAIWIGNKKGAISLGKGRAGGAIAAPIWINYLTAQNLGDTASDFLIPEEGLTKQTICGDSGLVPRGDNYCPKTDLNELFYSGTEPGDYCPLHLQKIVK